MVRNLIIMLLFSIMGSCIEKQGNYLGTDIRLFKGEAWQLAKAVEKEDIDEIRRVVGKRKIPIDFQEKRFGTTLLMWSVITDRYESAKTLLELGADPNLQDSHEATSAIMFAANKFQTSKFVKLLLDFGGDPSAVSEKCLIYKCTPLIAASKRRLESVKILVEAGADIDFMTKHRQTALSAASRSSKIDITYYLMIEKGAEFKQAIGITIDGEDIFIVNNMRKCTFPLDSEDYKTKMKIVDYMQERGVNYWEAPVPKHYYQIYDSSYLKQY